MNGVGAPYEMVTDPEALRLAAQGLSRERAIGVDLEADSMFHYPERVCLVQFSTPKRDILVDPLSLADLSPLRPVFADPGIRKVFHGADYDMRSLYRDFGIEVEGLFDTQIAARFLGIRETGLAALLQQKLGEPVEKKFQKKDWSRRPLPGDMLAYAVQDTRHLLPLSRMLEKELRTVGRLSWFREECEILSRVRPAQPDEHPLFMRFKGARRLDPRGLAVLESILQLREETARMRHLPLFKILGNEPVMEIARTRPETGADLAGIPGLGPVQQRMLGPAILKGIREAMALPEEALPRFPRSRQRRIGAGASRRIKALKEWRDRRAEMLGLDPSIVSTNAQIEALALAHPSKKKDLEAVAVLRRWQEKTFGQEICELLAEDGKGSSRAVTDAPKPLGRRGKTKKRRE
ncbi:MAG: ribonuclease D [Deltaproteobacteria bacterium]|nr:ribonuclease D [Deltaproteobacteria bacterium]